MTYESGEKKDNIVYCIMIFDKTSFPTQNYGKVQNQKTLNAFANCLKHKIEQLR